MLRAVLSVNLHPCHLLQFQHGSTHFYHIQSDGLRWVAASGQAIPALQVLCWLSSFRDVIHSICGAATESALRANHLTLRQLAMEVMVSSGAVFSQSGDESLISYRHAPTR